MKAGALLLMCLLVPCPAAAQHVREDLYVTDGSVRAIVRAGNTLYIGGEFSHVGPATGAGVPIDATSGLPVSSFPKVVGTVLSVASDGAGGWYVGGDFAAVGGVPRANLAHILSDNTLAPWTPDPNGIVIALVTSGSTVYASGSFTSIGGAARSGLSALDAATGLATAWDPGCDGSIAALALGGTTVYVGGWFGSVGGQSRNGLAALDATTGLATAWDPSPDGAVRTLAVSGTTVYAGGEFTSIGGQARSYLAALDGASGLATAWNPNATGFVHTLKADGAYVYAIGDFQLYSCGPGGLCFGGNLGRFDVTTGLHAGWNFDIQAEALTVSGTTVYVAGRFGWPYSVSRFGVSAADATTGSLTAWAPPIPNGPVAALAADGATVYVGGSFNSLGGQARSCLAALDLTTGEVTDWHPDVRNQTGWSPRVSALVVAGSTLYVGGYFTLFIPVPNDTAATRHNLAAFDLATGQPTVWDPNGNGGGGWPFRQRIAALATSGSTVYVGGRFNRLGGQVRNNLAALNGAWADSTSDMVLPWNPSPTDSVAALAVDGDIVYVGGTFDSIGAQPRGGLAALSATEHDSTDGVTLAWNPNPWPPSTADRGGSPWGGPFMSRGPIRTISVSGSTVYVGGPFEFMGGVPSEGGVWRRQLAAIDATTGIATGWDAGGLTVEPGFISLDVLAVVAAGDAVYVGGSFGGVGGQARRNLAALDPVTGAPTPWNPDANGGVNALLVDGSTVFAGGGFTAVGGLPQSGIAAMGDLGTPTLLSLASAEALSGRVRLMWLAAGANGVTATVYRRTEGNAWAALGSITGDGTGLLVYEDTRVSAGERYGYRLGVRRGASEEFFGEAWVDVPRVLEFALAGPRPNPATRELGVAFSLPDASPARLEVLDLGGRRVLAREVGALGPGSHVVNLAQGRPLPPGVYLLRLSQGGRSLTARAVIVR